MKNRKRPLHRLGDALQTHVHINTRCVARNVRKSPACYCYATTYVIAGSNIDSLSNTNIRLEEYISYLQQLKQVTI